MEEFGTEPLPRSFYDLVIANLWGYADWPRSSAQHILLVACFATFGFQTLCNGLPVRAAHLFWVGCLQGGLALQLHAVAWLGTICNGWNRLIHSLSY